LLQSKQSWRYTTFYLLILMSVFSCSKTNESSPIPEQPRPEQPRFISATGVDGYVDLNWSTVQYAHSYNIYFSTIQNTPLSESKLLANKQPPYTHTGLINNTTYYYLIAAVNTTGESVSSEEISATPTSIVGTNPLFIYQWNLENTAQVAGAIRGEDINLAPLITSCNTEDNCRGEGILVAIVDTGLEISHEDLFSNVAADMSINYLDSSYDPTPSASSEDPHGTAVAGIVAARDQNSVGLRGVAPRASLVGYNFLQVGDMTTAFDALTHDSDGDQSPDAGISVNSWGPLDNGELHAAEIDIVSALKVGVEKGRNGLGTVYVWAAGNGAKGASFNIDQSATGECNRSVDNSNYDGFANDPRVMAIGAVTEKGLKASYSECGANLWISAPAGEFCNSSGYYTITSTDLSGDAGINTDQLSNSSEYTNTNYTKCFNGTSAATPTVAGVAALMLQQSTHNLSWRDIRFILANTARINDPGPQAGWTQNGAGISVNHKYGFGVVDSLAAVAMAKDPNYLVLDPEVQFDSPLYAVNLSIPDNNSVGVEDVQTIANSSITKIEYVEITLTAAHAYFADLEVILTHTYLNDATTVSSESRLAETHLMQCEREISNCSAFSYNNWRFGSSRHLGEPADGTWMLSVRDKKANLTGQFDSWKIKFYGS